MPKSVSFAGAPVAYGLRRHDHVLRLDVAMHDAALVGVLERVCKHRTDCQQIAIREPAAAIERCERAALDQLGHEVVSGRVIAGLIQRDDRRVVEARCGAALSLDSQALLRIVACARDALDGDALPALLVARDPDGPVAARSDLLEQPVAAEDEVGVRVATGAPPGGGPRARKRRHSRAFVALGDIPARRSAMMGNLQSARRAGA